MTASEDARKKLEQLKKDQETLKAQLAELDTYLMKKYGAGTSRYPTYRPTQKPVSYFPRQKPHYTQPPQYQSEEINELRSLLSESIQNSKRLMEKFDYLLDALISSLDDMNSEDIDKTIRIIAESQAHILDNLTDTREALDKLEKETVTKDELKEWIKEYKERYAELAKRMNELMSKVEEPAVMDAISALQTQLSQLSAEVKDLEENVKKGGKTEELVKRTNDLMTRMQSLEERLKTITDLVQGMSQHVYASEAAMARVASLEQELSDLKQLVQTLQSAVMQEADVNKIEMEKAVKEIEEATKGMSDISELVEEEKERGKRLDKFEKEMLELEEKLAKMNEIDERLSKLEKKLGKIERFVDVYPIGEVHELAQLKEEMNKNKPSFKTEQFERLENRLSEIENRLNQILREREAKKSEEIVKLEESIHRLDKKLEEIDKKLKESSEDETLDRISALNTELEKLRTMKKELSKVKDKEGLKEIQERLNDLNQRLEQIYKEIDYLHRSLAPTNGIKSEIIKMEEMLKTIQKSSMSKREVDDTISTMQEMIDNLDTKLEKLEKQHAKREKEVKKKLEESEKKIEEVEDRIVIESRASLDKQRKLLLTRLMNLERLSKMGLMKKQAIKNELKKVLAQLDDMIKESRLVGDKKTSKELIKVRKNVENVLKSKSPEKKIEDLRKKVSNLVVHPKQKIEQTVSGLFLIRKDIEERSKADRKTISELNKLLKQIREVEDEVRHKDIEDEIRKIRKELEVLIGRIEKNPVKHSPKLENLENRLLDIKDELDELDKERTFIFKLENELETKEKEIEELNKKLKAGSGSPDIKEKIKKITSEISDLRKRITRETLEINNVMRSLNEAKAAAKELVPISKARESLAMAKAALKKKDIKSAKRHLKKAREALNNENKEISEKVEEIDKRVKKIGEIKEEKLTKLKEKHGTGIFSPVLHSLNALVNVHKRGVSGKEPVRREQVEKMKEHVSGLMILVDEIRKRKTRPEDVKRAREKVESAEREIIHADHTPPVPKDEMKKALQKAEKEAEALTKEIKRVKRIADETGSKKLSKDLEKTWIKTLLVQEHTRLTKEELDKVAKSLKASEKQYAERIKKLEEAKKELEKKTVPIEMIIAEFIENMKHGERMKISDMAKALRINKNMLLEKLKSISGNFKLENVGVISKIAGKEPTIVRV